MASTLLLSILLGAFLSKVIGYPQFRDKIPNGDIVPNPCNRLPFWPGVGHQNSQGEGPRNPFGLDFKANNLVWNRTLCEKDSDGDGLTNGQELGDPSCTWTEGSTSTFSITTVSHPGICEPLDSTKCFSKNSWLTNCSKPRLDCPSIKKTGVRNYTMRLSETRIPAVESTYICRRFTLPNDSVADIVAIEPVIVKAEVLQYMLLFGCTSEPPLAVPANESYLCETGDELLCPSLIGVWTIGSAGQCLNSQLGFRVGPGGFQYAVIQLFWSNPHLKTDLLDSSGFRIYYTTQLRPNAGNIYLIGQTYLEIPSGEDEVTVTGSCNPVCTRDLPHSVFITSAVLHMKLLGKRGNISLLRNGSLLHTLVDIPVYVTMLNITEFENPVEIKPGDEVRVTCVYESTERNSTTFYGRTLLDEMCYGLFAYYPLTDGVDFCGQWRTVDRCDTNGHYEFASCDFYQFLDSLSSLNESCAENCSDNECPIVLDKLRETGCLDYADVRSFARVFFSDYYTILQGCASNTLTSEATTSVNNTQSLNTNSPPLGNTMASDISSEATVSVHSMQSINANSPSRNTLASNTYAGLPSEAATSFHTRQSLNTNPTSREVIATDESTISTHNYSPERKASFLFVVFFIYGIRCLSSLSMLALSMLAY